MHNQLLLRPHPFAQDPGIFEVRAGQSLAAMLREGAQGADLAVALQVKIGGIEVPRSQWERVRPKAGTAIHVTGVPKGSDSGVLRAVLMIAVAVLAWYAAPMVGGYFGLSTAAAASGVYMLGSLTVPALTPECIA
jgi:hypothetical protein